LLGEQIHFGADCANQPRWDYYERFLEALLNVVESSGVLSRDEIEAIATARRR
jgi:nitrile hydratase subunit beta